jgi:hypothetical protein
LDLADGYSVSSLRACRRSHICEAGDQPGATEAIQLYPSSGYNAVPAFNAELYAHHWRKAAPLTAALSTTRRSWITRAQAQLMAPMQQATQQRSQFRASLMSGRQSVHLREESLYLAKAGPYADHTTPKALC